MRKSNISICLGILSLYLIYLSIILFDNLNLFINKRIHTIFVL